MYLRGENRGPRGKKLSERVARCLGTSLRLSLVRADMIKLSRLSEA